METPLYPRTGLNRFQALIFPLLVLGALTLAPACESPSDTNGDAHSQAPSDQDDHVRVSYCAIDHVILPARADGSGHQFFEPRDFDFLRDSGFQLASIEMLV